MSCSVFRCSAGSQRVNFSTLRATFFFGIPTTPRVRNLDCPPDIRALGALVTATEQQSQDRTTLYEVHAIPRTMIDAQLEDALADRLAIAHVAKRQPANARVDPCLCNGIAQTLEPTLVRLRLEYLDHGQLNILSSICKPWLT